MVTLKFCPKKFQELFSKDGRHARQPGCWAAQGVCRDICSIIAFGPDHYWSEVLISMLQHFGTDSPYGNLANFSIDKKIGKGQFRLALKLTNVLLTLTCYVTSTCWIFLSSPWNWSFVTSVWSTGQRLLMMVEQLHWRRSKSSRWWTARSFHPIIGANIKTKLKLTRRGWTAWRRSSCCSSWTTPTWSSTSPPSSRTTSSTSSSSLPTLATSLAWSSTSRSRRGWP